MDFFIGINKSTSVVSIILDSLVFLLCYNLKRKVVTKLLTTARTMVSMAVTTSHLSSQGTEEGHLNNLINKTFSHLFIQTPISELQNFVISSNWRRWELSSVVEARHWLHSLSLLTCSTARTSCWTELDLWTLRTLCCLLLHSRQVTRSRFSVIKLPTCSSNSLI